MTKFVKGKSGNPRGRPRGTSHAAKLRSAIDKDLMAVVKAVVAKAKDGDIAAAKLLIDRSIPPLKPVEMPISLTLSRKKSLPDLGAEIIEAIGKGKLTPEQATKLLQGLGAQVRLVEAGELEKRVAVLEQKQG